MRSMLRVNRIRV